MADALKKGDPDLNMRLEEPQICSRCVMDTTDPSIEFFDGVCNHCRFFDDSFSVRVATGDDGKQKLDQIVHQIKKSGKGKEYDCIAGVSGGVDSTYVVYLAKQMGLRPLAIHFDNGWNSELAVSNIETVLSKLDVDLFTYVVDWEEFKDLQMSFLKASTPDSEIPTDHAIYALLIKTAIKHRVKYILNGMNFSSESIVVPEWAYGHSDWIYIKNVHKQFGSIKLKTYPRYSLLFLFYALLIKRIKFVSILNYIDYDKESAVKLLSDELGWRPYGGKHHESIYTRFFQSYILPRKFNIDKRKAHLSNLIHSSSGGMIRRKALEILSEPPCDLALMEQDRGFVIKKFGLTEQEFDDIMSLPKKTFYDYKTNYKYVRLAKRVQNYLRSIGFFHK